MPTEELAPSSRLLEALNALIAASKPLVKGATRAVLGEGPVGAPVAFVGEQPGDQEDLHGRPFVGPAGQLLDRAMAEAGLDRQRVYVTNAVKHFKFEQRGKRRIHQKPTAGEVKHYRWWLDQELKLVHPKVVVALGATAVLALAGKSLAIGRFRGRAEFNGRPGFITVHPSYLLRIPDRDAKATSLPRLCQGPAQRRKDGRYTGRKSFATTGSNMTSGATTKVGGELGIWIGTFGWTYNSWRGPFYPPEIRKKDWLRPYGSTFSTTEINASFYRTPSIEAVRDWRQQTLPDFVFAWKASKFITHWKRLNDNRTNSIALMEARLKLLGPAGPVLFQLPGNFEANPQRLRRFITMLPRRRRYAFEFRHSSWYVDDVFDLLSENNISLCLADHHQVPAPWMATASHVYVRGHGPDGRYRTTIRTQRCAYWAAAHQRSGMRSAALFTSILITIRRARLPRTRSA